MSGEIYRVEWGNGNTTTFSSYVDAQRFAEGMQRISVDTGHIHITAQQAPKRTPQPIQVNYNTGRVYPKPFGTMTNPFKDEPKKKKHFDEELFEI